VVYAIEMAWPSGNETVIHSFGTDALGTGKKIESVALLGASAKLQFQQEADGLRIGLPQQAPGKYAYAFRILFRD
jgi:alpha-L-fucosidase